MSVYLVMIARLVQAPQRQSDVAKGFVDFVQACHTEVLAAEKLGLRLADQLADSADIQLLHTFSSTHGQFKIIYGFVPESLDFAVRDGVVGWFGRGRQVFPSPHSVG